MACAAGQAQAAGCAAGPVQVCRVACLADDTRCLQTRAPAPGGCGRLWPVSQALAAPPPRVFTLQLVWESHEVEPAGIASALRAVRDEVGAGGPRQPGLGSGQAAGRPRAGLQRCVWSLARRWVTSAAVPWHAPDPLAHQGAQTPARIPQIDLSQLYGGVPEGAAYRLRSMVCYYGALRCGATGGDGARHAAGPACQPPAGLPARLLLRTSANPSPNVHPPPPPSPPTSLQASITSPLCACPSWPTGEESARLHGQA